MALSMGMPRTNFGTLPGGSSRPKNATNFPVLFTPARSRTSFSRGPDQRASPNSGHDRRPAIATLAPVSSVFPRKSRREKVCRDDILRHPTKKRQDYTQLIPGKQAG